MEKKENILNNVCKHIERVLPRGWWHCIKDYRFSASCEWNLAYVLEVLMAGALSGCKTLREIETLSELYAERVPDTTLHDMMIRLDPTGLKRELAKGVKHALREHELDDHELPVRITAIDGKGNFTTDRVVNSSSEPVSGGGEGKMYRHMALRAMIVSTETKLYLGQREIPSKGAETSEFLPFIDELQVLYGTTSILNVISVDAGMTSKANADGLRDRNLHYIMALKGSQPRLYELALQLLGESPRVCVSNEIINGVEVTRSLFRVATPSLDSLGLEGWKHLQEIWKVVSVSTAPVTGHEISETRYFLSSLPVSTLSGKQVLSATRMHWGIENNANWCFDVLWKEDTAPWTSKAMALVAYIRMMAYNIISRLKTRKLRAKNHRALGWRDFFKYFEHALIRWRTILEYTNSATPAFLN